MYERGRAFRYMNTKNEASLDYESGGGEKVEKERERERKIVWSVGDRSSVEFVRSGFGLCVCYVCDLDVENRVVEDRLKETE